MAPTAPALRAKSASRQEEASKVSPRAPTCGHHGMAPESALATTRNRASQQLAPSKTSKGEDGLVGICPKLARSAARGSVRSAVRENRLYRRGLLFSYAPPCPREFFFSSSAPHSPRAVCGRMN